MESYRTGHTTEKDSYQQCCGHSAVFDHLVFHFRIKIYIWLQRVIDQLSKRDGRNPSIFQFLFLSAFS
jgi:hypothetical protein